MTPREYWRGYQRWYRFVISATAHATMMYNPRPFTENDFVHANEQAAKEMAEEVQRRAQFPTVYPVVYGVRS